MPIVEKLGSPRYVLAVLRALSDEAVIRDLAVRYHIDVPGFRAAQAPINLLARAVSTSCWKDRALREALDALFRKVASSNGGRLETLSPEAAIDRVRHIAELPGREALPLLLNALDDPRAEVTAVALDIMEAVRSGELRVAPFSGAARAAAAAPPERPERSDRPERKGRPAEKTQRLSAEPERSSHREPSPAERAEALREIRQELTAQEQKIQRLREQLETERAAHRRTRLALEALEKDRGPERPESSQLKAARREGQSLREEIAGLRMRLDETLRDQVLVAQGVQALEEALDAVLAEQSRDDDERARPHKPPHVSALPPQSKFMPPAEAGWPRHLRSFLERVAASPYVERILLLGVFGAGSTRVMSEIPPSMIVARFSDGEMSARLLIVTVASSDTTRHWVRRHLTEEFFSPA